MCLQVGREERAGRMQEEKEEPIQDEGVLRGEREKVANTSGSSFDGVWTSCYFQARIPS